MRRAGAGGGLAPTPPSDSSCLKLSALCVRSSPCQVFSNEARQTAGEKAVSRAERHGYTEVAQLIRTWKRRQIEKAQALERERIKKERVLERERKRSQIAEDRERSRLQAALLGEKVSVPWKEKLFRMWMR